LSFFEKKTGFSQSWNPAVSNAVHSEAVVRLDPHANRTTKRRLNNLKTFSQTDSP